MSSMATANKNGQMVQSMKVIGETGWPKAKAHSTIPMETSTTGPSYRINPMVMENTLMPMAKPLKECGKMTSKTVKASRSCQMGPSTKVPSYKGGKREEVSIFGMMGRNMKVIGWLIIYMGKGAICGQMGNVMWVNGKRIRCTVQGCILGLMEGNMKVNILTTRSMAMENTHGQMANPTMANGLTANNMAKVNFLMPKARVK